MLLLLLVHIYMNQSMNVSALAGNVCDRIDAGHLVHPNGQLAVVLDACV